MSVTGRNVPEKYPYLLKYMFITNYKIKFSVIEMFDYFTNVAQKRLVIEYISQTPRVPRVVPTYSFVSEEV